MKKLFFFVALSFLMSGCLTKCYQKITISQLKALPFAPAQKVIKYEVTGYYSSDPVPMLVSDTTWLQVNMVMPDSVFIRLVGGPGLKDLIANPNRYYGRLIKVQGTIRQQTIQLRSDTTKLGYLGESNRPTKLEKTADPSDTTGVKTEFEANGITEEEPPKADNHAPSIINICTTYPAMCNGPLVNGDIHKFALLYSGGYDDNNAKIRYWNDLAFMYYTLRHTYGYPADHIIVVYKDGHPEIPDNMPVTYAANIDGFNFAIDTLRKLISPDSSHNQLLVFTTNHGGGYYAKEGALLGGKADSNSNPDEREASNKIDETIFYYSNEPPMLDEKFAAKLSKIPAATITTLNQPCFSGGLLWDLRNLRGAINMAAAGEMEKSWAHMPNNNFDNFSYYFTAAMNGRTHDNQPLPGNPVNLDMDPRISILEAFLYAGSRDSSSAHLLDDNGSGSGDPLPVANGDGDGFRANTIYF